MKVCVLGLGYVGTVAGACLARSGCEVVGVDVDGHKVELFSQGRASFVEPELDELLRAGKVGNRITGSTDVTAAILDSDLVIITVGTPSGARGKPDLSALAKVAVQIGHALSRRSRDTHCTLVLRSTVPPGTTRNFFIPRVAEAAGRAHGDGWSAIFSPEFLREGVAIKDFQHPPQTVVGCIDAAHADRYLAALAKIEAPVEVCDLEVAELMKYACNAFHAVKIAFANELGAVSHASGADGRKVMELVCRDRILNISPAYLRPGNAFGGSCLPKDLKGITQLALEHQVSTPLLSSVLPANEAQIARLVDAIRACPGRRVGLIGLAFKEDTDDLRDAPMVRVARELLLDGCDVRIFDQNVSLGALRGRNLQFVRMGVPMLADIMVSTPEQLIRESDTLVLARNINLSMNMVREAPHPLSIIDAAGVSALADHPGYHALFW